MNTDPFRTARRELNRRSRFGRTPQACIRCGYVDLIALISSTRIELEANGVPSSLFQGDHVVGKAHDPKFIFSICRNCHALVTDERLHAGISMLPKPDQGKRECLRLEALSLYEKVVADALRRWATEKRTSEDSPEALRLEAIAVRHDSTAVRLRRMATSKRLRIGKQLTGEVKNG